MTRKENNIIEWLISNNELWKEVNSSTNYSEIKTKLEDEQKEEVKSMLNVTSRYSQCTHPIFSGQVCYLENPSFLTKDSIQLSRNEFKEYVLNKFLTIDKDGISIHGKTLSKDYYTTNITGTEHDNDRFIFPELPMSYYSRNEEKKRNCCIKLINDCNISSDLYFRPGFSVEHFYAKCIITYGNESTDEIKKKKKNIIGKIPFLTDGELPYKIKECNDLYIDMAFTYTNGYTIKSFKNFPDIVHGNFVLLDWDNIISFDNFPKHCEREVVFRNCRIPFNTTLPNDIVLDGNLICYDCTNDYNLLIALIKSNWVIKGKIYSSIYTGTLDNLRDIAVKEKWDII